MKTAAYPGSFDPITYGHIDVIKRALKIFDRLIILVGDNPQKKPVFSTEERIEMLNESLKELKNIGKNIKVKNIEVEPFRGLLLEHLRKKSCNVVIRGLRAVTDFEIEFQRALLYRELDDEIETIFVMTKDNYAYLNSGIVKEIAMFGGTVRKFVPEFVESKLRKKFPQ